MNSVRKSAILYGGTGSLGTSCTNVFKKNGWNVVSISHHANASTEENVVIPGNLDAENERVFVNNKISQEFSNLHFQSIICLAGGWISGKCSSENLLNTWSEMNAKNMIPSLICANLATKYLSEDGLLCFTSSESSLKPSVCSISYNLIKSSINNLCKSLSLKGSGIPKDAHSLAILPGILDTIKNRELIKTADHSCWQNTEDISKLLFDWSSKTESRPPSGSLITFKVKDSSLIYDLQ